MKLSNFVVAALLPFAVLGAPAADASPTLAYAENLERDVSPGMIEKRAVSGIVKVDGLRYRTCPRTSCAAVGQYPKGKRISLVCYTRKNTTTVNGDKGWAKLTNGRWVALAYAKYVSWSAPLPACK